MRVVTLTGVYHRFTGASLTVLWDKVLSGCRTSGNDLITQFGYYEDRPQDLALLLVHTSIIQHAGRDHCSKVVLLLWIHTYTHFTDNSLLSLKKNPKRISLCLFLLCG